MRCAGRDYLDGDDDAMDFEGIPKAGRQLSRDIGDDVSQQRCGLGSSAGTHGRVLCYYVQ